MEENNNKILEIFLGLLFPISGIGVGYLFLGVGFFILQAEIPAMAKIPIATILFGLWAVFQFSFSSIEYDETNKRFRTCYRILYIFKTGKWTNMETLEAFYTRPASLKRTVSRGSKSGIYSNSQTERYKDWLLEIKFHNNPKYRPIAFGGKSKIQKIRNLIFDHSGLKHERIIPNPSQKRRR